MFGQKQQQFWMGGREHELRTCKKFVYHRYMWKSDEDEISSIISVRDVSSAPTRPSVSFLVWFCFSPTRWIMKHFTRSLLLRVCEISLEFLKLLHVNYWGDDTATTREMRNRKALKWHFFRINVTSLTMKLLIFMMQELQSSQMRFELSLSHLCSDESFHFAKTFANFLSQT